MTKGTTYTAVAPNGQTFSRTSKRAYTHAVLARADQNAQFFVWAWNGSALLAQKAASAARNENELSGYYHQHTNIEIANARRLYGEVVIVEVAA
jgi:hypothetical protein